MRIEEVFEQVAERKKQAEKHAASNLESARENDIFKEADLALVSLEIEIAKAAVFGLDKDFSEEREKVAKNYQNALKSIGFTEKMLKPNYTCKKCNDNGFFMGEYCSCVKALISEKLMKESGVLNLPCATLQPDLSIFTNSKHKRQMELLYNYLREFADAYPNTKHNSVLLMGEAGIGKTYALSAIARKLIEKGVDVVYLTAFAFSQMMLDEHTNFTEERGKKIALLQNVSVLIIDDLGSEPLFNNVTEPYLLSIFNERTLCNKKTVFSTNLAITDLNARYGSRFTSRINLPILLKGTDLRK